MFYPLFNIRCFVITKRGVWWMAVWEIRLGVRLGWKQKHPLLSLSARSLIPIIKGLLLPWYRILAVPPLLSITPPASIYFPVFRKNKKWIDLGIFLKKFTKGTILRKTYHAPAIMSQPKHKQTNTTLCLKEGRVQRRIWKGSKIFLQESILNTFDFIWKVFALRKKFCYPSRSTALQYSSLRERCRITKVRPNKSMSVTTPHSIAVIAT